MEGHTTGQHLVDQQSRRGRGSIAGRGPSGHVARDIVTHNGHGVVLPEAFQELAEHVLQGDTVALGGRPVGPSVDPSGHLRGDAVDRDGFLVEDDPRGETDDAVVGTVHPAVGIDDLVRQGHQDALPAS